MKAMVLQRHGEPLTLMDRPDPQPSATEVRVRVAACGVCRTDLHVVDGELPDPKLPIVPGHEIVGRIDAVGAVSTRSALGERVGIPWLGHTCGSCPYCLERPREPLRSPRFSPAIRAMAASRPTWSPTRATSSRFRMPATM